MAKLGAYYSLCPLIDQKSLLGVAEDSTTGCVVVTLGRNMVVRYKLLNQKQINSWSSKEKLSSPVIYDDVGNQYFAVFNKTQLRMWTEDDGNLDKVKKIKFQEQVHSVLPQKNGGEPLIIFNNGIVETLSTALEIRTTKSTAAALSPEEEIEDCHVVTYKDSSFVTLFCRHGEAINYYVVPVSMGNSPLKFQVARDQFNLIGQATVKDSCELLTLWSDGKIYSLSFFQDPAPESPGTFVNIVGAVSTKHPVAMTPLSSTHIAMYGADPSEEGAVVMIYNIRVGVVQSRHHFKIFAQSPRIWCVNTSLLVAMTHNLVVMPYQLEVQELSALLGVRYSNATQSETDPELQELNLAQCWKTNGEIMDTLSAGEEIPKSVKEQLNVLETDSCPLSVTVEKFLLQLIEKESADELLWCLKHFPEIPEKSLVQVLQFCLDKSDIIKKDGQYTELVNSVLSASFSDVCLLPFLRTISFPHILSLLKYLADELESDDMEVNLDHLLNWANLLLDAHYQQYLLSGDPEVQQLLSRLQELSSQQILHMNELKELVPVLKLLQEGKLPVKKPVFTNKLYSVELLKLY